MNSRILQTLTERYPFISIIAYGSDEFVGIVQNRDDVVTTFYDFGSLTDTEQKQLFLDLGEQWWFESANMIPINLFLRGEWSQFRSILKTFNSREVRIIHGPATSLSELSRTKVKRRSVTLVRKTK